MIYTEKEIRKKINKKEKRKKILEILVILITLVLLILLGYVGYLKFVKKTNDISLFGFRFYIVSSGSMEPNYNIGDIIIIKEKSEDEIKVGDVINFVLTNENNTVTHRVVNIIKENDKILYQTKGDNNTSVDSDLISFDKVHGIIVYKICKLGLVISKILSGTGIFIIVLFMFLSYLYSDRKEEKKIARESARKIYNTPKYEKEDII